MRKYLAGSPKVCHSGSPAFNGSIPRKATSRRVPAGVVASQDVPTGCFPNQLIINTHIPFKDTVTQVI